MAPVTAPTRGQAALAQVLGPQLVHYARQPVGQRRIPRVLQLGGAGIGRANEHEAAGPVVRRRRDERLERVAAEERVGGEGVGPQARRGAERAGGLTHERLGVRARGHGNVAPFAVGQHEQPVVPRDGDHLLERLPTRGAEALEAGQLRLDRHAGRARGDDRRPAVLGHRLGGQDPSEVRLGGPPSQALDRSRPQGGGIGIESEHDTTAALVDERRKPVGEVRARGPRQASHPRPRGAGPARRPG